MDSNQRIWTCSPRTMNPLGQLVGWLDQIPAAEHRQMAQGTGRAGRDAFACELGAAGWRRIRPLAQARKLALVQAHYMGACLLHPNRRSSQAAALRTERSGMSSMAVISTNWPFASMAYRCLRPMRWQSSGS